MTAETAGYSGTPQSRKLGLAAGMRLALHDAPEGWTFDDEPAGLQRVGDGEPADLVLAFIRQREGFAAALPELAKRIFPNGMLWIAWPRKAAGHVSDVNDNFVRTTALEIGLVDVKVAALSTDWSALKLVWRKENRSR